MPVVHLEAIGGRSAPVFRACKAGRSSKLGAGGRIRREKSQPVALQLNLDEL